MDTTDSTSSCILVLQLTCRSLWRNFLLQRELSRQAEGEDVIVCTPSAALYFIYSIVGVDVRLYIRPWLNEGKRKERSCSLLPEEIIRLSTSESDQYKLLTLRLPGRIMAMRGLNICIGLSRIKSEIESKYKHVRVIGYEAGLIDHLATYTLWKDSGASFRWISLICPSNLVGITQGDPTSRDVLFSGLTSDIVSENEDAYRACQKSMYLHSSSYLNTVERVGSLGWRLLTNTLDMVYIMLIYFLVKRRQWASRSLQGFSVVASTIKTESTHVDPRPEVTLHREGSRLDEGKRTIIHYLSSPRESFSSSRQGLGDEEIVSLYITEVMPSDNYNIVVRLHPHFERLYSAGLLKKWRGCGIILWDPRYENEELENILRASETIVSTSYGSVYFERILQQKIAFTFSHLSMSINTLFGPREFVHSPQKYAEWFDQNSYKLRNELLGSVEPMMLYDPRVMFSESYVQMLLEGRGR